jgi:hypothetical protein
MARKRSVETAPGAEAPRAREGRDEPAELQRMAGNRAAAALFTRPSSAALLRGLGRAGNASLARLLDPASPSLGDLQSVAASAVNELAIAHDLLRAIDQHVDSSELQHGKGRKVNFPLIDHVLTGLSPSQLQLVFTEYRKESSRDLRDDLLGGSGPLRAEMNDAQRARATALLAGTALESAGALRTTGGVTIVAVGAPDTGVAGLIPSGLGYDDAAKVIARNRAFADAAELALLLEDGKPESVTQILRILRKSAAANDMIAAAYERQFDKKLEAALGKLGGPTYERALALRYGSWDRADALAIESVREAVAKYDQAAIFSPGAAMMDPAKFAEARRKLVAGIEEVLATIATETAAEHGGSSAAETRAAISAHLTAVLAIRIPDGDEPGTSVADLLKDSFKPEDLAVIDALRSGDPVEAAAARIARADAAGGVDLKLVSGTLRELRAAAEREVGREAKAKGDQLKHAGLAPDQMAAGALELGTRAEREVEDRSHRYVTQLAGRIDQLAHANDGHRWSELLEALDKDDAAAVNNLMGGAGKLAPADEIREAMRQKDMPAVLGVLRGLSGSLRRGAVKDYDASSPVSLAAAVAGKTVPMPSGGILGGVEQVRMPRTDDEAAIAELIEAPDPGGESEIAWTFKWTRDTYERALKAGGITGEIADVGGREVRELMDDSANEVTDAHIAYRRATTPEEQEEALRKLRNARAAITGDKTAYIADTDAIRASIANNLAMVVDIALTIMMPEAAGAVSKLVGSLVANIGTKFVIMQDQYSADMLKSDLVGAVVSMGFAAPGKLAGEEATKLVGSKLAGLAEQYGWKVSAELKSLAPGLVKLGGNVAENVTTGAVTNVALGKSWDEDLGSSTFTGVVKGYGTSAGRTLVHGAPAGTAPAGGATTAGDEPSAGTRPAEDAPTMTPAAEEGAAPGRTPGEEVATPVRTGGEPAEGDVHTRPTRRMEAVKGPDEEANPYSADPDEEPTAERRTPMALDEDEHANDFEHEEKTGGFGDEKTVVHDYAQPHERPVGEYAHLENPSDPLEAYATYKQWIKDDPSREVSLLYNFQLDEWAVVQGERSMVDIQQAYKRLGWRPEDAVLDSHNHPARVTGKDGTTGRQKLVTSEENRQPSGVREDLGVYAGDAAKRSGPQISAIDVETEQGTQRVLTSFDPAQKTWTVSSPRPGGGRDQRVFTSYKDYHEWFYIEFGVEPSKTEILGLPPPGSTSF